MGVPGDAQTKHPWESYSDFFSRKGRFTYEQAMERKGRAILRATDAAAAGGGGGDDQTTAPASEERAKAKHMSRMSRSERRLARQHADLELLVQ